MPNPEHDRVNAWWVASERDAPVFEDSGESIEAEVAERLRRAHDAELAARMDECRAALDGIDTAQLTAEWAHVHELLECRLIVRRADVDELRDLLRRLQRLLETLDTDETGSRARALHLAAIAWIRLDNLPTSEELLTEAAEIVGDAPALSWIAENFAQILTGQGAWEEAQLILRRALEMKREGGDSLGVAISTGSLARLHSTLDDPQSAIDALGDLWRDESLPAITRLRLSTLRIEAQSNTGDADIETTAVHLEQLLAEVPHHHLAGYAQLALANVLHEAGKSVARALGHRGSIVAAVEKRLEAARAHFSAPAARAWLEYTRVKLLTDDMPSDEWLREMRELFDHSDRVTEGEIRTFLMMCERAHARGMGDLAQSHLAHVTQRAVESNNPIWVRLAEGLGWDVDPKGHADRLARRLSGRGLEALSKTERRDATIIFSDLVNFTPRTQGMAAEDVMATVRSVFQLTSSQMATHGVRPLTYMGDGLLAVAEGEDHQGRALRFATDIVGRAGRITRVRRALSFEWPLELRAGVATGPVVMGALGTQFKQEFAAIGLTTNRAARLQGKAEPGEVVTDEATARAAGVECRIEELELKGFPSTIRAVRIVADTPRPKGSNQVWL